jgi:hypothetical protein
MPLNLRKATPRKLIWQVNSIPQMRKPKTLAKIDPFIFFLENKLLF